MKKCDPVQGRSGKGGHGEGAAWRRPCVCLQEAASKGRQDHLSISSRQLWFNPKCRVFRGSQEALAPCTGRPTPACGLETRAPGHSRRICAGPLKSFMELLFSRQVPSDSATPWL